MCLSALILKHCFDIRCISKQWFKRGFKSLSYIHAMYISSERSHTRWRSERT